GLGIKWNAILDTFTYTFSSLSPSTKITKRQVLSSVAKLFDPAGWLAPIVVRAKICMQQLWLEGKEWDEEISEESLQNWNHLVQDLSEVELISIPRWIQLMPSDTIQIHGFCDASKSAYCATVYIRCQTKTQNTFSNLLVAKSKVAPLQTVCLPRLELNVLARIEGVLNSRPISAVSEDPSDLTALTPVHFLRGAPLMAFPEQDCSNISVINRWENLKVIHHQFSQRWKNNYLKSHHKRYKWKTSCQNMQIGDLVIVMDDLLLIQVQMVMFELPTYVPLVVDLEVYYCVICTGYHGLKFCRRFRKMTPQERQGVVERLGYCTNCLARSHNIRSCTSMESCVKCKQLQHTLLHPTRTVGTQSRMTTVSNRRSHNTVTPTASTPSVSSTPTSSASIK
ncbi:hypothetical protein CVS40_12969, partial [Lucilia cuprina]